MDFERFKNIVQYNIEHQSEMKEKVQDFRETVGITQERNLPNLLLFARPMMDQLPSIHFKTEIYRIEFPWSEQEYITPGPKKAFFECGLL